MTGNGAGTVGCLLLIGSRSERFRKYLLRGLAGRADIVLIDPPGVSWPRPLVRHVITADLADSGAVLAAARLAAARVPVTGVVTYDEALLETAAAVAGALGVPGLSAAAAAACRDKLRQREAFTARGVPSARWAMADTGEQARRAAAGIGYPVIVKPRALAGSIGVRRVTGDDELVRACELAAGSSYPGLGGSGGVLVEEYLDGPEISVDSWVLDGEVVPFVLARKRLGFAPHFEEIGHTVGPLLDPDVQGQVDDLVRQANLALGLDGVVTHTEVRLTPAGPRVIEVNARPGGDLIPYLGLLSTGADPGRVLADVSARIRPDISLRPGEPVSIRFVYPRSDLVLGEVSFAAAAARAPWLREAEQLKVAGTVLRLPPRGYMARAAYLIGSGPEAGPLERDLDRAAGRVDVGGTPA